MDNVGFRTVSALMRPHPSAGSLRYALYGYFPPDIIQPPHRFVGGAHRHAGRLRAPHHRSCCQAMPSEQIRNPGSLRPTRRQRLPGMSDTRGRARACRCSFQAEAGRRPGQLQVHAAGGTHPSSVSPHHMVPGGEAVPNPPTSTPGRTPGNALWADRKNAEGSNGVELAARFAGERSQRVGRPTKAVASDSHYQAEGG